MKAEPKEKMIWFLWMLSTMVMVLIGVVGRYVAHKMYHTYNEMGIHEFPDLTILALGAATHLFKIAIMLGIATCAVMIWMIWKGADEMEGWALAIQWIIFVGVCGFIALGLLMPFEYLCSHLGLWYVS